MPRPALPLDQQRQPGRGVYQATCLRINRRYASFMAELSDSYQADVRLAGMNLDNGIDQLPLVPEHPTEAEQSAYFEQRAAVLQSYQDRMQELSEELDEIRRQAAADRNADLEAAKAVYTEARRQADLIRKGITEQRRGGRRG